MRDGNLIIRANHGYRLMFAAENKFRLDDRLIPVVKAPRLYGSQVGYAKSNVKRMSGNIPDNLQWLFNLSNAIASGGKLPSIWQHEMSTAEISRMRTVYEAAIFDDHDAMFNELKDISPTIMLADEAWLKRYRSGESSIWSLLRYHREVFRLPHESLNDSVGIIRRKMHRVFSICCYLEDSYQISMKLDEVRARYCKK